MELGPIPFLCKHAEVDDGHGHSVIAGVLWHTDGNSRAGVVIRTAGGSRSVGQCAIDNQRRRAINIGDVDQGLVQRVVAAVSNKIVQIFAIIVLVTTACAEFLAETSHRQRRVGTIRVGRVCRRFVNETIGVVPMVWVDAVEP